MDKKDLTPIRQARRKYEEKNKEVRKAQNKVWGTSIPRKDAEDIDDFLVQHGLTKVDLIYAGFQAIQDRYKKEN